MVARPLAVWLLPLVAAFSLPGSFCGSRGPFATSFHLVRNHDEDSVFFGYPGHVAVDNAHKPVCLSRFPRGIVHVAAPWTELNVPGYPFVQRVRRVLHVQSFACCKQRHLVMAGGWCPSSPSCSPSGGSWAGRALAFARAGGTVPLEVEP